MKKSSVYFSIVIVLFVETFITLFGLALEYVQFEKDEIQNVANSVADVAELVMNEPDPVKRLATLESLKKLNRIGYYIIGNSDRQPASTDEKYNYKIDGSVHVVQNTKHESETIYVGAKLDGQDLVIGSYLDTHFINTITKANNVATWTRIVVISLLLICVLFYSFKDIVYLMNTLKWSGSKKINLKNNFVHKETQAIANALNQASNQIEKTESQLEMTRMQLLPSLLSIMDSDLELPYNFNAVLLRIDINNSTEVYTNANLKFIQQHWFDYFKLNAAEIATRYGGFAHEELGDEIIIYFKLSENPSDVSNALCSVRDVFELAIEVNKQTKQEYNYTFTVKAAVDIGQLRVFKSSLSSDKNSSRLKIEGLGESSKNLFLTTVRLLKLVKNKSKNMAIVSDTLIESLKDSNEKLIKSRQPVTDMPDEYTKFGKYSWIDSFVEYSFIKEIPDSILYRADRDLIKIFNHLNHSDMSNQEKLDWVRLLRPIHIPSPSLNLQVAWLRCLKELYTITDTTDGYRLLASFISTGAQFMRLNHSSMKSYIGFEKDLEDQLLKCILHSDARVQANSIELWGALNLQTQALNKNLKIFRHNRSLANAMIIGLTKELNAKHLSVLRKMLKHNDPFMRAAGCYAVGRILEFYQKNNSIVLSVNSELISAIKMASNLTSDKDEMVSRQAHRVIEIQNTNKKSSLIQKAG